MADSTQFATAANPQQPAMFEQVSALVDRMVAECPLGVWMREQGFDPARGCVVVLPEQLRADVGPMPPPYVRFSRLIGRPVLVDLDATARPLPIADPLPPLPPLLKRGHNAALLRICCP